ncbi:phosphoglycerate mutase-like protein [Artomyces pyxidatus]|uniref:Phosphoglycerate mutase-like protein n=1 Tax=Artomyces pyxidatus TaxID=48021 RepID=A0ACB8TC88_9AGAM|nr:phosphoglycerate mutase-like protein [Artomyces pyxidatus]
MLRELCLIAIAPLASASIWQHAADPQRASSYAGATSTFAFPPQGMADTFPDPAFPDASAVGFPGPTPTGDEAFAIATAPALAGPIDISPVVAPDTADHRGGSFAVAQNWGNLSPMVSLAPGTFGLPRASPLVPAGCALQQVHILHRHGARYPSANGAAFAPAALAAKLHSAAAGAGLEASGPLEFLNTWVYKLGGEILTPFGRQEMYSLGVGTRMRYGDLLKGFSDLPVWRTTSQERMVDSALQFAAGFFGIQEYENSYHQLVEIEATGFNSTLAAYDVCPNANNAIGLLGYKMANKWGAIYTAPIIKRLSQYIQGVNFTANDIVTMQQACAYESVALGYSEFCDIFTKEEWISYQYFADLGFWYTYGPGNPAVAAQGVGYVQEFISRLAQTRITAFDTSVNGTIVSSNVTFPLDQPIFVDATHDTIISAVVVALNLTSLSSSGPLPTDHIPKNRQWITSNIVPFASNLVAQVLSCPASTTPTHVRWILNDAVVPLTGIAGCKQDPNGLCELEAYINGTQNRIAEIDFQYDCFANYTIPDPDTIVDGRFPPSLRNGTA